MVNCRKSVVRAVSALFCCLFFFSCGSSRVSSLSLSSSGKQYPLAALNKAARNGVIADSEQIAYLYYGFSASDELSSLVADESHPLSLKLSFTTESSATVTAAFLYDTDFDGKALKQGTLSKRPVAVTAATSDRQTDLLFALPADKPGSVKGFLVQSDGPLTLTAAELCTARFGLILEDNLVTVGFGPDGGSWLGGSIPDSFNFSQSVAYDQTADGGYVIIHFRNNPADAGSNGHPGTVTLSAGSTEITCRRTKETHQVTTVYAGRLQNRGAIISVENNKDMLTGIEYAVIPDGNTAPIITDPGCIIDWPVKQWRGSDYEYFAWDTFPSILFFDTRDYNVQDDLFKRLAFFAEKEGWRGTLAPDSAIKDQHGYNAHDYKAETLAAFFDKAEKEKFPLNRLEKELCAILADNGLIIETRDGWKAGEGAIISISQESARYLRSQLLSHETFHGLYFTTESFRTRVAEVRNTTEKNSLDFIYGYFASQPSLGYDPSDEYLMQNEFMAYVMQLGVGSVPSYFAENLACRGSVMQAMPELSAYIRETNAAGIVEAAEKLDDFVFENWSMNAGRPWIVSMGY
ncbi:MAG: hypothetical protein KBT02_08220 [Treponema sp.]|nr:hypothetical protein [Candidatus Treponema caballi]